MRKIPAKALAIEVGQRLSPSTQARKSAHSVQRTVMRARAQALLSGATAEEVDEDIVDLVSIQQSQLHMRMRSTSELEYRALRLLQRLPRFHDPLAALLPAKTPEAERQALEALAASSHALSPDPAPFSLHQPDYTLAAIHAAFPWMAEPSTICLRAARQAAAAGTGLTFPPVILCGPPGVGKSSYARALADSFNLPTVHIDVGSAGGAVFDLQGLEAGWGNAQAGRLARTIIATRCVNPLVIIDEIDRAGPAETSRGARHPGLPAALMSIIEPSTSRYWTCPYYKVPFDMSAVSVIMTCNSLAGIDQPLLDRCRVIHIPDLTGDQIIAAVPGIVGDRLSGEAIALIQDHLGDLSRRGRRLSLRAVSRMIDGAVAVAEAPILQ